MSVSVLAVDDEADVAELFRQHFRREVRQGIYVLHFAYSAEEALDKLARGIEPQLIVILSDINMPSIDGLTLLRQIKERRPDLPVIMVTAYGDDERRRRANEYGAADFITKPVDFDFLKAQLRQLAGPAALCTYSADHMQRSSPRRDCPSSSFHSPT
jgi:CheY-like chemotaxis protein